MAVEGYIDVISSGVISSIFSLSLSLVIVHMLQSISPD